MEAWKASSAPPASAAANGRKLPAIITAGGH